MSKVRQAVGKTTTKSGKDVLIVQYHESVGEDWEFKGVQYKVDEDNFGRAFTNRKLGGKVCYAYIVGGGAESHVSDVCSKCGSRCFGDCSFG